MSNKHKIILPPPEKAPNHTSNIVPWMWYFLLPYKWTVIGFFIWRLIRGIILGSLPIALGLLVDKLEDGSAFNNPEPYIISMTIYMLLYTASMGTNFVFHNEVRAFEKAARGMTLYAINHLNKLSLNWHEKQGSGGKLQRVMTGRKGYQEFCRHVRWDFFHFIGQFFAVFISFFAMDIPWYYVLFFIGMSVTYSVTSWILALPFIKLYDNFHVKFENLLAGVYEFVSAIRTVKSFHLNKHITDKASVLEEEGQEAIMKTFWQNFIRWSVINTIAGIWMLVFVVVGFFDVIDEKLTIGGYTAMVFLAYKLWNMAEIISEIQEKLYEYGNGFYRLVQTLRVTPKNLDLEPHQDTPNDWQNIILKNLSYSYDENKGQGVRDITIKVARGQKIAFVGNSGAGKSTLVKLLMKQMLQDSGEFTIDGVPVSNIPTDQWLEQIGFVPQDVELFNLSIRQNILIDRDDIDDDVLHEILKQSALDEFIASLPEGLNTVIGERGIKLSGGQRQRLGIARALVRQAPIMIFDEATSSLDSISEAKIQTAIENSFSGRTVFVIAHRLSTIRNVDHIIVLDHGRIIEQGPFSQLLEKNGHFAKLWAIQSEISQEIDTSLL